MITPEVVAYHIKRIDQRYKPGFPLTPAEYQRKREVIELLFQQDVQRSGRPPYRYSSGAKFTARSARAKFTPVRADEMGRLWSAILGFQGRPFSLSDLMLALKLTPTALNKGTVASRLSALLAGGAIEQEGTAQILRSNLRPYTTPTYRVLFKPNHRLLESAEKRRARRLEALEKAWKESPFAKLKPSDLKKLPERWRQALKARLAGKTLDEVAADLGVTRQRALQIQNQAIKKIAEG